MKTSTGSSEEKDASLNNLIFESSTVQHLTSSRDLTAAQRPRRRRKGAPESGTCWSRDVHIDLISLHSSRLTILTEKSMSRRLAVMNVVALCPAAGFCWLRSITIKLQKSSTQRPIDRWIPQTHRPQRGQIRGQRGPAASRHSRLFLMLPHEGSANFHLTPRSVYTTRVEQENMRKGNRFTHKTSSYEGHLLPLININTKFSFSVV